MQINGEDEMGTLYVVYDRDLSFGNGLCSFRDKVSSKSTQSQFRKTFRRV